MSRFKTRPPATGTQKPGPESGSTIPMPPNAPVATPPGVWAIGPKAASADPYRVGKEAADATREAAIPQGTAPRHPALADVAEARSAARAAAPAAAMPALTEPADERVAAVADAYVTSPSATQAEKEEPPTA